MLRYSVYSNGGNQYPIPGKNPVYEKSVMPGPMREIGKAILTIREHAEEWLVDMNLIVLTEYSAGANNCALYCVYWDNPVITDYLKADKEMLRPAAAVLGYGVYDYPAMQKNLDKLGGKDRIDASLGFNLAFFGTEHSDEETMIKGSPTLQVHETTPPMFLWSTREDNVVPVRQSILMANALAENNIPFELHIFERGMHGLALADQATSQAKEQIISEIAQWPEMAKKWLEQRFEFDVPDVCPKWEMPKE